MKLVTKKPIILCFYFLKKFNMINYYVRNIS